VAGQICSRHFPQHLLPILFPCLLLLPLLFFLSLLLLLLLPYSH
jgi:hypothetical protein